MATLTFSSFEAQAFLDHAAGIKITTEKENVAILQNPDIDPFEVLNDLAEQERQRKHDFVGKLIRLAFELDSDHTRHIVHALTMEDDEEELRSIVESNYHDQGETEEGYGSRDF